MIKKFDEFINEGLIQNIKKKFNPTTDEKIEKLSRINDKILDTYKDLSIFKDEDTFCEYLQYCEDALNLLNKLVINNHKMEYGEKKNSDFININDIAITTLNNISETFPNNLKAKVAPEWFIEQLKFVIKMHRTLAELFEVETLNVTKFNRI